jgi:alcohol dehydrogenase class IV
MEVLPKAIKWLLSAPSDLGARESLAKASVLSGKAIAVTRTTAPHALSYPLTILCGVPHGAATGLLLSHFVSFNYEVADANCNDPRGALHVKNKIEKIAEIMTGNPDVSGLGKFLREILSSGPEISFSVSEEKIKEMMKSVNAARLSNNPRKLDDEIIKNIYKKFI